MDVLKVLCMPDFSIIIPVYNTAPYLKRCLDSICDQNYRSWEAICVNDGSTDSSAEILENYAHRDKRILIENQNNSGVVAARVKGFSKSHGKWIIFLDSDDSISIDCLQCLQQAISLQECDIFVFGYCYIKGSARKDVLVNKEGVFSALQLLSTSCNDPLQILGMCIGNKCYRRSIAKAAFNDVGDLHIGHSEDGLFAFAALLHSDFVMFCKETHYRYFIRENSTLRSVNLNIAMHKDLFIERLMKIASKSKRMSKEQMLRTFEFHSYLACSYIFLMLRQNEANWRETEHILLDMRRTSFFSRAKVEAKTLKRRMMMFILQHPMLYYLLVVKLRFPIF